MGTNQNARKLLFTDLVNTKNSYSFYLHQYTPVNMLFLKTIITLACIGISAFHKNELLICAWLAYLLKQCEANPAQERVLHLHLRNRNKEKEKVANTG